MSGSTHEGIAAMPSDQWTPQAIRKQLAANRSKGLAPSAQVFLGADVHNANLGEVIKEAIDSAASRLGRPADVTIGRVRPLAKSASVTGDPDVIAEMLNEPSVTAILPSAVDDVFPRPVDVKRVE